MWVARQGDAAKPVAWKLLAELRAAGVAADMDGSRGMKGQFKLADAAKAAFCVVVGDAEVADGSAVVKDMRKRTEVRVPRGEVVSRVSSAAETSA